MRTYAGVALVSVAASASVGLGGCAVIDELKATLLRWVESEKLPSVADDLPEAGRSGLGLRRGFGIGGGYHESRSIRLVGYCASPKISENCILFEAAKAQIVREICRRPHLFSAIA